MKIMNDPLSFERVIGKIMNKKKARKRFLLVMIPILTLGSSFYNSVNEQELYNKMDITFNEVKSIEYGTEFNGMDFVDYVSSGEVVSCGNLDTTKLGSHEIMYIVSNNGMYKEIYTNINVIDTKVADINISEDNVTIYVSDDYDVTSNISSVVDNVDGDLPYKTDVTAEDKGYYTISTDFNKDVVGDYTVNIKAVDNSGNISEKSYTISVIDRPVYRYTYTGPSVSASVDTTSVVTAAYSYLGHYYTPGGASPETGFDCSGFVYYIYGLFGKTVGRSTSDIIYSGTGVSYDDMNAGDILVWGTGNYPTHAALYVGDGMMIHAANSNDGVILSSVSDWASYGYNIVAIRRV